MFTENGKSLKRSKKLHFTNRKNTQNLKISVDFNEINFPFVNWMYCPMGESINIIFSPLLTWMDGGIVTSMKRKSKFLRPSRTNFALLGSMIFWSATKTSEDQAERNLLCSVLWYFGRRPKQQKTKQNEICNIYQWNEIHSIHKMNSE